MNKRQQYIRVGSLGVFFMLMFTAFNSLQNMISSIYSHEGYTNLGQMSLFAIYLTFGATTLIASYVIEQHGYKRTMFLCSLGYALF
jgi:hypothetical protein